jgi:hypothetical protein
MQTNDSFTQTEESIMSETETIEEVMAPEPQRILPISELTSMDGYLANYGSILGKKAITALDPLHLPSRDPLPDFDDLLREPFEAQKHVIAASMKMMDTVGGGFICGEMGAGKSIIGCTSVHMHASKSRNQGGKGGKYRAVVLCPDHLIAKWVREIEETIPDAIVSRFGPQGGEIATKKVKGKKAEKVDGNSKRSLRDVISLLDKRQGHRWEKPKGAEWYIIGRNQAKWMSDWTGLADMHRGFSGEIPKKSPASKSVVVDKIAILNEKGYLTYNKRGEPAMSNVTARVFCCPKCGTVARDKKGVPLGEKDLSSKSKTGKQLRCVGTYMEMIPVAERPKDHGRDRFCPPPSDFSERKPNIEFGWKNRRWVIKECGEPLFGYVSRPYRWSLAKIIQKKMKRMFGYLIIDEIHEQKSDESAQSMACGKLLASVDHVIGLTGTIIGGYANHLFPLMMRITPRSLKEEGFEWGRDMAFSEVYGRIDQIITTKEQGDDGPVIGGNVKSMRRASSGSRTERKTVRPGVMPTMFGRHLIGSSMFIKLEDVSENLPDLFEYIGGELLDTGNDAASDGWFDTAVDMDYDQKREYDRVAATLELANRDLLQRGSMKLLGAYLWTTMDYPDRPFGWEHDPEVMKAAISNSESEQAPGLLGQSFLKHFDHKFDSDTNELVLARLDTADTETDRIKLKKDGGVWWLDVTLNGKVTKPFVYDTGASTLSIPAELGIELGLKPKNGDHEVHVQVADGSLVKVNKTTMDSVKVGKFTVHNTECTVLPLPKLGHTVGYWEKPGIRTIDNFVGVVTPKSLPEDVIYPKEQKLIDICLKQKADGTQTWVYVQMTGKRNVQDRLKGMLEREGLKVGILRATDVQPIEREEWIAKNGRDYDVMISHPQLVSTGLDLFSKAQGGHNYSTIVFYETGYNLFTMRQAARRAWRIGQPRDCRVYYMYYKDTMQHKAMSLMSKKMAAAQALEGEFSEEGLAAMAGEDNLQMALAKNLSERINGADMQRSWSKVKIGPKKVKQVIKPSPLDDLPIELQMVGESLVESQSKPVPEEVKQEWPKLKAKLKPFVPPKLKIVNPIDESEFENFDDYEETPNPVMTADMMAKMFAAMIDEGVMTEEELYS